MNYPFHMPGHKKNPAFLAGSDVEHHAHLTHPLAGAIAIDTTETDATDDLHHAGTILKEAQDRANALYASAAGIPEDKLDTHYLVGGATAGVLAALSAAVPDGGHILAARNAHQSLYHAAYLRHLSVSSLFPEQASDRGRICPFCGALRPSLVEDALCAHPDARALFLTSPTYEGVLTDMSYIVRLAHDRGIPVIVDEAHGAHLSLSDTLPPGALSQGADIVIHAVHKTLAALTQTALLHVQGTLIDRALLRRFLRIYQSSSPSYVLMASIDAAVNDIRAYGEDRFRTLSAFRSEIEDAAAAWSSLVLVSRKVCADPCKIVLLTPDGFALADALRNRFQIEPEMVQPSHVVLILTPYDTASGVRLLLHALTEIDREMADHKVSFPAGDAAGTFFSSRLTPVCKMKLSDAWDAPAEDCPLSLARGRISAETILAYPPGIPLLLPGEVFDDAAVLFLQERSAASALYGVSEDGMVRVLLQ